MKSKGQITKIMPIEEFPSGFAKRTVAINTTPGGEYEHLLVLDTKRGKEKDRTSLLDLFHVGQMVEVEFSPDGRLWADPKTGKERLFCGLTLLSMKSVGEERESVPAPAVLSDADVSAGDDLPF